MHPAWEYPQRIVVTPAKWSPHPPRVAAPGEPPELFLFVLFFDFRRHHGLRKGQRERVADIRRGRAALLHVGLPFQHGVPRGKYTLNRPHPNPSPGSGDRAWGMVARR